MTTAQSKEIIQQKGTYVKIRYRLRTEEGEYVKGDPQEGFAYLDFFTGYKQVMPALEKRLIEEKTGEKIEFSVSAEEAFGSYCAGKVKKMDYESFPEGRDLQEGKYVVARDEITRTSYGYFVRKKEEDHIILDYNHPLAGKSLVYNLEILEVRAATQEERNLLRPCEETEGDKDNFK